MEATMKTAIITGKEKISDDIYSMWIKEPEIAEMSRPGKFISVYCKNGSRLLPRPISICETEKDSGLVRIVFRIAGEGTREIASFSVTDSIQILGPLGNGFMIDEMDSSKTAVLIGGGIGIPPMLELAKALKCKKKVILGYRNSDTFLAEEFKKYADITIATEDGSEGTKGNVIDAARFGNITGDMVFSCGPLPMLKGVKEWAGINNIRAQLSLEERMACGIGACLACVCKTKEVNEHTNINNARVCKDGPVFYSEDIEL